MDGVAEAGSNSSLHTTPEQSVAAQSQHHQQFIGEQTAFVDLMSHIWADHLRGRKALSSKPCLLWISSFLRNLYSSTLLECLICCVAPVPTGNFILVPLALSIPRYAFNSIMLDGRVELSKPHYSEELCRTGRVKPFCLLPYTAACSVGPLLMRQALYLYWSWIYVFP